MSEAMRDIEAVKVRLRQRAAHKWYTAYTDVAIDDVTALLDAHDAAEARIAKLEEAMKPFAEFGEIMIATSPTDDNCWVTCADSAPVRNIGPYGFTFGHFRRAVAALEEK